MEDIRLRHPDVRLHSPSLPVFVAVRRREAGGCGLFENSFCLCGLYGSVVKLLQSSILKKKLVF